MGCASCGVVSNGKVSGCGSSGGCSSGGCNRMNVYDWFADIPLSFNERAFNVVEVSFKQGARKGYYRNVGNADLNRGDLVVVEAAQGSDIGEVSLQGELVKIQMKKKGIKDRSDTVRNILRVANEQDKEQLKKLRALEYEYMVKARVMAREIGLEMKLGDVEMQGDGTKATFFYTAEDRVDFRELVRRYAKEFRVKIEMRQIGARQEAARIGGIGSCGLELCCSSWLTDFKTVNTTAARYQNLSINTDKLSGQCGRLKCCLNYELDAYVEATKELPKEITRLETKEGTAKLIKTEILTRVLWFKYEGGSDRIFKLSAADAKEIWQENKKGIQPESLAEFYEEEPEKVENKYEELVGHVSLNALESKDKKRRKKPNPNNRNRGGNATDEGNAPKSAQQQGQGQPRQGQGGQNRQGQGQQRQGQGGQNRQGQGQGGQNRQGGGQQRQGPPRQQQPPKQGDAPKQEGQGPKQEGQQPKQGGRNRRPNIRNNPRNKGGNQGGNNNPPPAPSQS